MREITIRDLLRSPKSFLPPPTDGIRVVRRDGADFYIYPDVRPFKDNVRQTSDIMSDIPKSTTKIGRCEQHFEKIDYRLTEVTWEDENGEVQIDHKWLCPKCYSLLETKDGKIR